AQDRIDPQRPTGVIRGQPEFHLVRTSEDIAAGHLLLPAPPLLVEAGPMEADLLAFSAQHKVAASIQFKCASALEAEANSLGISAWRHYKVVLQLCLVAVVDQVDARIDALVSYLGVGSDPGAPVPGIASDKIVGSAGQTVETRDPGTSIGAHQLHIHQGPCGLCSAV